MRGRGTYPPKFVASSACHRRAIGTSKLEMESEKWSSACHRRAIGTSKSESAVWTVASVTRSSQTACLAGVGLPVSPGLDCLSRRGWTARLAGVGLPVSPGLDCLSRRGWTACLAGVGLPVSPGLDCLFRWCFTLDAKNNIKYTIRHSPTHIRQKSNNVELGMK